MMASGLFKHKVGILRQMCIDQGLGLDPNTKLTKAQLVEMLTAEENADNPIENVGSIEPDDNNDVDDDSENDDNDGDSQSSESGADSQLAVLKLKLQLAKAKLRIEKERHALAKMNIGVSSNQTADKASNVLRELKGLLPTMSQDSDIVSFFFTLERTFQLHNVSQDLYVKVLPSLLNTKCQKVYSKLTVDECRDYVTVKNAILASFKLNAKAYHDRFTSATRNGVENYKLFLTRLHELFTRYIESKSIVTMDDLIDDCVCLRFLDSLNPPIKRICVGQKARNISGSC